MADSLSHWLLSYLTTTAETYGARIENVPRHEKKKKVQIIEFLTYGSEAQDTYIWARVSDKQYSIPIKFSKEAIMEYASTSHTRLTQHKGAIVTIKNFRPMLSRLPVGPGGAPSAVPYLALECDYVSVLGCSGEGKFGNPAHITNNVDMSNWAEGLNQAGGAGNILKDRRKQQLEREDVAESSTAALRTSKSIQEERMPPPAASTTTTSTRPTSPKRDDKGRGFWVGQRTEVTDLESYYARWKPLIKNPLLRFRPDENATVTATAKDIPDSPVAPSKSRSASPLSDWDMTESSPAKRGQVEASLSMPTPAQRPKKTPQKMASSSPQGNETKLDIEMPILQSQSVSRFKRPVARKVPRPVSPPAEKPTGPARVLVPNSDTSGMESQSQSMEQSQSQSQPRVPPDEILAVQGLNGKGLVSRQAPDANPGTEGVRENETGDDEHAAMEAEIVDGEAPRGREGSEGRPGPSRRASSEKREGEGTRVSGSKREGAERGGDAVVVVEEKEEEARTDAEGDMEDGAESWPWMSVWAVQAVAAATREARLGKYVGLIR